MSRRARRHDPERRHRSCAHVIGTTQENGETCLLSLKRDSTDQRLDSWLNPPPTPFSPKGKVSHRDQLHHYKPTALPPCLTGFRVAASLFSDASNSSNSWWHSMTERNRLLASIATTIVDYKRNSIPSPTPEHVDQWVSQFQENSQLPILREMDHVLKETYFSRKKTKRFLRTVFRTKELVGNDPCGFWNGVKFLDIQEAGRSQKEMLALFSKILEKKCGTETSECGDEPHSFVYFDDGLFTGNRILFDLRRWIEREAPAEAKVHIVVIALHTGGEYYAKTRIEKFTNNIQKNINFHWWRMITLEDRKYYTTTSDVLRPVELPDDHRVRDYVNRMAYDPTLRTPGNVGSKKIFSSDAGRQVLERELLIAGVRIREMCPHLNQHQRPLGNTLLDTLGFGSLIVTFRNCPNNAPLALWAGDPWYPLFPRTTN